MNFRLLQCGALLLLRKVELDYQDRMDAIDLLTPKELLERADSFRKEEVEI
jgi:hypothetical protein